MLVVFVLLVWPARGQDSARQLARILANKGVLTSAELASIEHADTDGAVRLLSAMLYEKGLLTRTEVASLGVPEGGVRFVPAVVTAELPSAAPATAQPQPQKPKE